MSERLVMLCFVSCHAMLCGMDSAYGQQGPGQGYRAGQIGVSPTEMICTDNAEHPGCVRKSEQQAGRVEGVMNDPSGLTIVVGGVKCALGAIGAGCTSDLGEIAQSAIQDAAIGCGNATVNPDAESCIKSAVTAAVQAAIQKAGANCMPVAGAIEACASLAANILGKAFNALWCDTYPESCGRGPQQTYANCVNQETPLGGNPECMACCMKPSRFVNCNNMLEGSQGRERCKWWNQICTTRCSGYRTGPTSATVTATTSATTRPASSATVTTTTLNVTRPASMTTVTPTTTQYPGIN